MGPYQGKIRQ